MHDDAQVPNSPDSRALLPPSTRFLDRALVAAKDDSWQRAIAVLTLALTR
jgi:hypothetical protein